MGSLCNIFLNIFVEKWRGESDAWCKLGDDLVIMSQLHPSVLNLVWCLQRVVKRERPKIMSAFIPIHGAR
jgi:hypothetical protein